MRWTAGGVGDGNEGGRGDDSGGSAFRGFGGFGGFHLGIGGTGCRSSSGLFSGTVCLPAPCNAPHPVRSSSSRAAGQEKEVQFVSFVIDDMQHTWDKLLPEQQHVPYHHAKLVLFRDHTRSGYGTAQSATGPFYCPAARSR